ncbi:metallophosphoesterase family protein [Flavivirga rizhaonensis]|uniref:Metallophosphoesterase n=1 Tax=Flavivirga rizhaonensis TaxID=2559571 RepID=A0A4S1E1Z9_9FLAO|nr:metallophosphoesterase family protein [Flavivirga rizhaonensis]TGV04731.1 metallophosphoesterase [Flavivirga rizhaonensis]
MNTEKIAIISDIHANSWALKEVLRDIETKKIDTILNLGDSLYGPLDPKGTFELLLENNTKSISGNQDRFIIENVHNTTNISTLEYVKSSLGNDAINWLKKLPFDLTYNNIYCCHGNPVNDSIALLEKINTDYVGVQTNDEIEITLSNIKESIITCGHSHIPRMVKTKNKTIVNPGSIGLPAYNDDLPIPHKMESLSPHAKYAILKINTNEINVELISVDYEFEAAARAAEKNNRNDWAKWIRTGRV